MQQTRNSDRVGTSAPSKVEPAKPKARKVAAKKSKPESAPPKPKNLPLFNVILLDDADHTYDYVIEMLAKVLAYPFERGYQLAKEVDSAGRVILLTTHKELAELKRDQIHAYGSDPRLSRSAGSMSAMI